MATMQLMQNLVICTPVPGSSSKRIVSLKTRAQATCSMDSLFYLGALKILQELH